MRFALICLLVAGPALADPKAVVKQNIVGLGNLENNDKLGLDPTATVIDHKGLAVELAREDGCVSGAVANAFYGCQQVSIRHEPGAITMGVDDAKGIAWFQAPFTAVIEAADGEGRSYCPVVADGPLITRSKGCSAGRRRP